ncbi:MAG TPA: HIT family protein [Gammaproteobacteria bacterium]|nr:HIT family protein [Gammaproteobacteria bacterium]
MSDFKLDTRLAKDCRVLGKINTSLLLLMNNSLVPWFILVPQTSETELTDLLPSEQADVLEQINLISVFIKEHFDITQLNTAAIGNIVNQLHIHVVGRDPSDYCWPNVVWGTREREPYSTEQLDDIMGALGDHLGDKFQIKEIFQE